MVGQRGIVATAGRAARRPRCARWTLAVLGEPLAEAELAAPRDPALVVDVAARGGRAHPRAGVVVLAAHPQLPGLAAGAAVVAHEQLRLRVDRVLAVREGELEELRLGDGLGGARLHAQVAVDAAQVIDLVDEAVALARRHRRVGRVVGAAHVDAPCRADARAQLAPDALLHAVLVAVEDVAAVEALRLRALLVGILRGDT